MGNLETTRLINFLINLGGQQANTPACIPTWGPEMADAFAKIEQYDHRVGLVLFHTKYRYLFAEYLQDVLAAEPWMGGEDEHCMGTLWGADVWCSPRAPHGKVLLCADPVHIDFMQPKPGTTVEIVPPKMFPGPDRILAPGA